MAVNSYRGFGSPSYNPTDASNVVARLKKSIGFSEEPVQDAQGYWTIGYGQRLNDSPGGPKPYATMSEPTADEMLRMRLQQEPNEAAHALNPPEQQVADLYVSRFPNAAGRQGHIGIGVNSEQTQGFYPTERGLDVLIGRSVPGTVKNDDMSEPHDILRIPSSPDQDETVRAYIDDRQTTPGNYNLYNHQCTDFVEGALRAGGVEIPSSITDTSANQMSPNRFFPLLRNRYGR